MGTLINEPPEPLKAGGFVFRRDARGDVIIESRFSYLDGQEICVLQRCNLRAIGEYLRRVDAHNAIEAAR